MEMLCQAWAMSLFQASDATRRHAGLRVAVMTAMVLPQQVVPLRTAGIGAKVHGGV